ncbi:MAG: enoyl-CoA hydratase/isomerase family protein [Propionibacteriales bacterium]|nr:enoyl-CoA hydratase/isomerase family protein [Propionibacteriales bacterium]
MLYPFYSAVEEPCVSDYTDLTVARRENGVVVATLSDPDRRNAMSEEMTGSWQRLMAELADDREVRCLVVTGAGTAFCSGGDLGWLGGHPDARVDQLREKMIAFYRAWLSVRSLEVPTIAAVNGPAIGAGLCLALACDLRYAAPNAKLAAPFTALGMHPGMAATWLLPDVVGPAASRDLLLTGRTVSAEEASRMGLVNAVLDGDAFLDEVLEVAGRVAAAAPVATRYTTLALRQGHASLEAALQWEALAQPITLATEDLREGLAAATERRTPRFTGR